MIESFFTMIGAAVVTIMVLWAPISLFLFFGGRHSSPKRNPNK